MRDPNFVLAVRRVLRSFFTLIIFLHWSFAYGRIRVRASETRTALWKCKLRLVIVTRTIPLRNRVFNSNLVKTLSWIILQNCVYVIVMPIAAHLFDHRATFELNRTCSARAHKVSKLFVVRSLRCIVQAESLRHNMASGHRFAARDIIIRAEFLVKCNAAAFFIKNHMVLVYVSWF